MILQEGIDAHQEEDTNTSKNDFRRREYLPDLRSEYAHRHMDRGIDIYQTDAFPKGLREGIKNVDGRNEPLLQPVIAGHPGLIELSGLKYGQNGSWGIA